MRNPIFASHCILAVIILLSLACSGSVNDDETPAESTGELILKANGESFVSDGFTSKDGWDITFEHVYVTVSNTTAFQTEEQNDSEKPRYHAGHSHGGLSTGSEYHTIEEDLLVDLKNGSSLDGNKVTLRSFYGVKTGHYNRVAWSMSETTTNTSLQTGLTSTDLATAMGNCITLVGQASKDNQTISFHIAFDEELYYQTTETNGTGGIVSDNGSGEAEITFHFDHIFGDGDEAPDAGVNPGALGFQPFADMLADGETSLRTSFPQLANDISPADMDTLYKAYLTLGHSGESHAIFIPDYTANFEESGESYNVGTGNGNLHFNINGEDFVRNGFVSKDGWSISFTHAYTQIENLYAGRSADGEQISVAGNHFIDMKEGQEAATLFTSTTAAAGHYDRVSWSLDPIGSDSVTFHGNTSTDETDILNAYSGNVIVLIGTATKDSNSIDFTLSFDLTLSWSSVGPFGSGEDSSPDLLLAGGNAFIEATFHFDHIFGDGDDGLDEGVNPGAVGFQPFADLVPGENGTLQIDGFGDLQTRFSSEDYYTLLKAYLTLGHSGEEHCFISF